MWCNQSVSKIADQLDGHADLGEAERHALRRGRTVRRGHGYSLHVTALPDAHRALLAAAAELAPRLGSRPSPPNI